MNAGQITLITEITEICATRGIEHWLRGGWAVDFYVGRITRDHEDIDLFAWAKDVSRLVPALTRAGFAEQEGPPPTAQRNFLKEGEEVQIALLVQNDRGEVAPAGGPWAGTPWPERMLSGHIGHLGSVRCPIVAPQVQMAMKELFRQGRPMMAQGDKHDADITRLRAALASGVEGARGRRTSAACDQPPEDPVSAVCSCL